MKRIWIIRHGQSENNRSGLLSGWIDTPLTEQGIKDAEKIRPVLEKEHFDRVYSSDLVRAKTTAETALPGVVYETTPKLREMNLGELAGRSPSIIPKDQLPYLSNVGYSAFGGESREEFYARISSFADELAASEYDSIAVFSHSGWLRGFLSITLGITSLSYKVVCGNCAIGVFEYDGTIWRLHSWMNLQ